MIKVFGFYFLKLLDIFSMVVFIDFEYMVIVRNIYFINIVYFFYFNYIFRFEKIFSQKNISVCLCMS